MFKKLDRSKYIAEFLPRLSSALAVRIGVPMLIGTVMIVVSAVCFVVVLPALVLTDSLPGAVLWLCLPLGILHLGLFLGFLAFMLATPLGAEYPGE